MENLFEALTSPTTLAAIAAVLAMITAAGKGLIKLGNMGKYAADDNDWLDSTGAFCMKLVDGAGKILAFLGPGNQQKPESGQK